MQPRFPENQSNDHSPTCLECFFELQLTVIGAGDPGSALKQEVTERHLNVNFTGTASAAEIREQLARNWLFVTPSITAQSGDDESGTTTSGNTTTPSNLRCCS
jgi:hypothetical protein